MKAHLSYWKYRAVIEPRILISERFHYRLRGLVTPKGTIHLDYAPTTVSITTLCVFPSLDTEFFGRYTDYGHYVYQELAERNTSASIELISAVEWNFEHEEEEIGEFLQRVSSESFLFSERLQKIIQTLTRVNPVEHIL